MSAQTITPDPSPIQRHETLQAAEELAVGTATTQELTLLTAPNAPDVLKGFVSLPMSDEQPARRPMATRPCATVSDAKAHHEAPPKAQFLRPEEVDERTSEPRAEVTPPVPEQPLTPLTGGELEVIEELLRNRHRLLRRIEAGRDLPVIARAMMVTVLIALAAFGAAAGFYRGGVQVLYAAIKLPVVLLLTVAICAPLFTALKRSLRHKARLVNDFALLLSAMALSSLVILALTPLLLLGIFQGMGYHKTILLVVGLCAIGGVSGYRFFFTAINRQKLRGHRLIGMTLMIVLGLVSTQFVWISRPYVLRPATETPPIVRPFEGSFLDALRTSIDSSRGHYKRDISAARHALPAPLRGQGSWRNK